MTSYSLSGLVKDLSNEGLLTADDTKAIGQAVLEVTDSDDLSAAEQQATGNSKQDTSPWYINVLIGFSAWLSSIFMIAFLFAMEILRFREKSSFFVTGIVFLGAGIGIYLSQKKKPSVFLSQMALALTMTGRIVSVIGFSLLSKSVTSTTLYVIVMESTLILLYSEKLQRFLSTFVIHGAVLYLFSHNGLVYFVYIYIALISFILYGLWVYEPQLSTEHQQELLPPVGYGTAVALLTVMAFSTTPATRGFLRVEYWWPLTAVMAAVWLLSCYSIAHQYRMKLWGPFGILTAVTLAAFCATAYQAPGVTAACFILTIAYYRDQKLLAGLAILGLIGFVILYYYGLRITLLQKSIAMLIPGFILLLARGAFLWLSRNATPPATLTAVSQ